MAFSATDAAFEGFRVVRRHPLALVFWTRPTGKVVLGLTLALLVVLAIIEFLGRPARPAADVVAGQT